VSDENEKKEWTYGRIGKWASATASILGLAAMLYAAGAQIWQMQADVQYLVDEMRRQQLQEQKRKDEAEKLQIKQQQMQDELQDILNSISSMIKVQSQNAQRIEAFEKQKAQDISPAIRFTQRGHGIEDGPPGGTVEITWQYVKLRDCGPPRIDLWLRNGGGRIHRFQNISVIDSQGRGIVSATDRFMSQSISYTARIPSDEGIETGRAAGWVVVRYPDCPGVEPVTSPEVTFAITEE
jgi:predicted house-cleaning noncanonical NTP pyrophosphatase (MazG superfamily)